MDNEVKVEEYYELSVYFSDQGRDWHIQASTDEEAIEKARRILQKHICQSGRIQAYAWLEKKKVETRDIHVFTEEEIGLESLIDDWSI